MMRRLHLCLLCLALLGMSQRSAADWRATLEQGRARYSNFAGGIPAPLALTALKSENPGTHQDLAAIAAQVGTLGQDTITQAHKDIFDAKGTLTTTDDWKAKLKEQQDAVNADMKAHVDKSFNEAMNKIEALPADQRAAAADHYNSLAGSVSHAVAAVVDGTLGSIQDAIQDLLKGVVDVFVSSAENIGKQILGTITSWF